MGKVVGWLSSVKSLLEVGDHEFIEILIHSLM